MFISFITLSAKRIIHTPGKKKSGSSTSRNFFRPPTRGEKGCHRHVANARFIVDRAITRATHFVHDVRRNLFIYLVVSFNKLNVISSARRVEITFMHNELFPLPLSHSHRCHNVSCKELDQFPIPHRKTSGEITIMSFRGG